MAGRSWAPEELDILRDCVRQSVTFTDAVRKCHERLSLRGFARSRDAVKLYLQGHEIRNPDWIRGVQTIETSGKGRAPKPMPTKELIAEAEKRGYRILRKRPGEPTKLFKIDHRFEGNEFSVGVVSDTQLGSKYQQLTLLHEAYDLFSSRGVVQVLHAGDLLDGQKMYRGHEFETFISGADSQRDYAVGNYPKREGITTYLIGGNHDYAHWRVAGADVLAQIAATRPDIQYLGNFQGAVEVGGLKIRLGHPRGGVPYARSYRLQKHIEQLSPQEKPDVALLGHLHVGAYLPQYRNVEGFQLPCFQSQTPLLAEMGVHPTIGFLILTFTVNGIERKDGLVRTKHEWFHCFVPRENDY